MLLVSKGDSLLFKLKFALLLGILRIQKFEEISCPG